MSEVNRISGVTLRVKNMDRSCNFYSHVPGFKLTFGGSSNYSFTTYQMGKFKNITFLNLELKKLSGSNIDDYNNTNNFGRIIFYTDSVDRLYTYFKTNKSISNMILLESEPVNAPWSERYFHIRDPDGYQLSSAQPI